MRILNTAHFTHSKNLDCMMKKLQQPLISCEKTISLNGNVQHALGCLSKLYYINIRKLQPRLHRHSSGEADINKVA